MVEGSEDGHRWKNTNRGPYIKTWSGGKVFIRNPQAEDFRIDDIAHHLAGINRYTGGSRFLVAQHCVVAAQMALIHYPNELLLPARMLIHDADEAFIGDISSPLKSLLPDYRAIEDAHQLAMEKRFDLTFIGDALVREIDIRMWLTEREVLFGGRHGDDDYCGPLKPFDDEYLDYFYEWSSELAEVEYLEAVRKYFPWLV